MTSPQSPIMGVVCHKILDANFVQPEYGRWDVDGSSSMTTAQNTKYKEKSHNEVMEWLSQSPKHNVMKNLWKELKLQAKKLKDL